MKSLVAVFTIVLYLSCVTHVHAIKCFTCDPTVDENCKNTPINCEEDEVLGHAFDSCYINEIIAEDVNGTVYTHITKNCGIKEGCDQLRDMMCDAINKTHEYLVKLECNVHCCDEHDYCNAEHPRKKSKSPDVQGFQSSSHIPRPTCILIALSSWLLAMLKM